MSDLAARIAGAPISWGVCEVPGWGWQYDPETVLAEMRDVGIAATEFGPDGFLPDDPAEKAKTLADLGLRAVGGFVPVVLHDAAHDPVPEVARALESFVAAGASTLVIAAATGSDGYDGRPVLDDNGWSTLLANLDRLTELAAAQGVLATIHPHVGTMIENADDVRRVLAGSTIGLTLDTGHLLIGGVDPVALTLKHTTRIKHTHLKDVDAAWAAKVQSGEVSYTDAVREGMYRPLGAGDVDLAAIVATLESSGYTGWYVLEQDTILQSRPTDEGPVADVRASITHLRSLAESTTNPTNAAAPASTTGPAATALGLASAADGPAAAGGARASATDGGSVGDAGDGTERGEVG
ncbi:Myo-inosose-2 dehydratase [Kribbella flavida DSM 17836]|uniref:Myo-inosose-2 dehydratase n=1 Tax=Kribbella flavida (strain DSM 17836 / JCM 10339 / NBRC 14399) TaxID=479435 RepID=D2PMN6_KRIFD|nr:sugar phosphate isomerase/epimerase [Kribbella flavida]ADB30780.1 Myo-inosose-2 dehydratase [Kribbella flavida DSM 17836]